MTRTPQIVDTSDQTSNRERRQLLGTLGKTGTVATIAYWHKPIINSVVLPSHAQTSEPVVLTSTDAVADTTGGLVVRAALSGAAKNNQRVSMEVLIASEPRKYATALEKVIKTDASGVAKTSIPCARLKAVAGDQYLVKLAPESLASAKLTTLKGQIKAAPSFELEVKTFEVSAEAVKVAVALSESVRADEVVVMNMAVANEKGSMIATQTFKVAAVAERASALATLDLSERDLASAGVKLAAGNKLTMSARMARQSVFGSASATLSKTLERATKEPTETTTTTTETTRPVPTETTTPTTRPVTTETTTTPITRPVTTETTTITTTRPVTTETTRSGQR